MKYFFYLFTVLRRVTHAALRMKFYFLLAYFKCYLNLFHKTTVFFFYASGIHEKVVRMYFLECQKLFVPAKRWLLKWHSCRMVKFRIFWCLSAEIFEHQSLCLLICIWIKILIYFKPTFFSSFRSIHIFFLNYSQICYLG